MNYIFDEKINYVDFSENVEKTYNIFVQPINQKCINCLKIYLILTYLCIFIWYSRLCEKFI